MNKYIITNIQTISEKKQAELTINDHKYIYNLFTKSKNNKRIYGSCKNKLNSFHCSATLTIFENNSYKTQVPEAQLQSKSFKISESEMLVLGSTDHKSDCFLEKSILVEKMKEARAVKQNSNLVTQEELNINTKASVKGLTTIQNTMIKSKLE